MFPIDLFAADAEPLINDAVSKESNNVVFMIFILRSVKINKSLFYKKQTFTANNKTIEVRINPYPVRNIYEGIKIPTGVITIEDANGSRSIIPVSGMLGCNLEN